MEKLFFSGLKLRRVWDGSFYGKNAAQAHRPMWVAGHWAYCPGTGHVYTLLTIGGQDHGVLNATIADDEEVEDVKAAFLSAIERWDVACPA